MRDMANRLLGIVWGIVGAMATLAWRSPRGGGAVQPLPGLEEMAMWDTGREPVRDATTFELSA